MIEPYPDAITPEKLEASGFTEERAPGGNSFWSKSLELCDCGHNYTDANGKLRRSTSVTDTSLRVHPPFIQIPTLWFFSISQRLTPDSDGAETDKDVLIGLGEWYDTTMTDLNRAWAAAQQLFVGREKSEQSLAD